MTNKQVNWVGAFRNVNACIILGAIILLAACSEHVAGYCTSDSDCGDMAPFCDVKGEYAESNFTPNRCSMTPANCPVSRCGCTPGTSLACSNGAASVCAADGHSTMMESCALGCSMAEPRCLTFDPSNDLGAALADAATQPDVILPAGAKIDTELGIIQAADGSPVQVKSVLVSQNGGTSMIRAFEGKSFVLDDATLTGKYAAAFVAPGAITLRGVLDASANGIVAGPGAQEAPAVCAGTITHAQPGCTGVGCNAPGGGGGGNATPGSAGGDNVVAGGAGGALVPSFVPLVGGCRGGNLLNDAGTPIAQAGGGGGTIQIDSLTSVLFTQRGFIDVGGGGGQSSAGGGSGGTIIIEAPSVRWDGAPTGVAANGGAGGSCGMNGSDATPGSSPAMAPGCHPYAGNGGTVMSPPTAAEICTGTSGVCYNQFWGGGGGAVGRLHVVTRDGAFDAVSNPLFSAMVTTATLTAH